MSLLPWSERWRVALCVGGPPPSRARGAALVVFLLLSCPSAGVHAERANPKIARVTKPVATKAPAIKPVATTKPAHKSAATTKPTRPTKPESTQPSLQRAQRLGLGTLKAAGRLLQGRPEDEWTTEAGPEGWNGTLRFPVGGGYATRGFGSGKGGYHQAVDIAAELGTKVRAAAGGLVGYAGSQVSGYGNLVVLIHPGGFVTMYAHNRKNLVIVGQRVRRNAVIAELGSTGRSKGPHLHFELLWNGQDCDPMPLFRPAAQRKNGAPAGNMQSAWKVPHKKPKSLRCGPRKHHPDYVAKGPGAVDDDESDEGSAF